MKSKKEVICWVFLAVWQLVWIIPISITANTELEESTEPAVIQTETEGAYVEEPEIETVIKDIVAIPEEIGTETVENETIIPKIGTEDTKIETPEPQMVLLGEFKITAYCSCKKCCGKWAENRPVDENGNEIVYGASGAILIPGYSVAVDPKVIPYGTKLYIDGKEYIAHDCGGAIKGNDIDVYILGHQEAWDFAAQYQKPVEVYMIVEESQ